MNRPKAKLDSLLRQARFDAAPPPPRGFCQRVLAQLPAAELDAAFEESPAPSKFGWAEVSLALAMVAAACLALEWAGTIFHFGGLLSGIAAIKAEWLITPY